MSRPVLVPPDTRPSSPIRSRLRRQIASLLLLGVATVTVGNLLHPAREDPMDAPRVFLEYAESETWVASHLLQFAGYLLVFWAAFLLVREVSQGADREVLVAVGHATAAAAIAVAAVLQGVDGVGLKAVVDTWAGASGAERSAAFLVAEAVRWTEIGINALFRVLQGLVVAVVGLAYLSRGRRLLAWVGILSGAVLALRGIAVAFVGFDTTNPLYLAGSVVSSNFPLTLLNVWLVLLAADLLTGRQGAVVTEADGVAPRVGS